jgi:hypothetical protein
MLFSLPGLKLSVYQLDGTLKCTLLRTGKASIVCDIDKSDLSDKDDPPNSYSESITAVGIQLRLLKNDGVVKVEFSGSDGAEARWTFNGLAQTNEGGVMVSALTRTSNDATKCPTCGQEKVSTAKAPPQKLSLVGLLGVQMTEPRSITAPATIAPPLGTHQRSQLPSAGGPGIPVPASMYDRFPEDGMKEPMEDVDEESLRARIHQNFNNNKNNNNLSRNKASAIMALDRPMNGTGVVSHANGPYKSTTSSRVSTPPSSDTDEDVDFWLTSRSLPTATKPDRKRKASATPLAKEPLLEHAKSMHAIKP